MKSYLKKITDMHGSHKFTDYKSRYKKAQQIKDNIPKNLLKCRVLDIGCSSGMITHYLSFHCKYIIGIDNDDYAISLARQEYPEITFKKMSATKLSFPNNLFDVVICHHIYPYVRNQTKMMKEINRVLKNDGIVYFAAQNKWKIMNDHNLPFLTWLPKKWADLYVHLKGEKSFDDKYYNYRNMRRLFTYFLVNDITPKILLSKHKIISKIARIKMIYTFCPSYIFLLRKFRNI